MENMMYYNEMDFVKAFVTSKEHLEKSDDFGFWISLPIEDEELENLKNEISGEVIITKFKTDYEEISKSFLWRLDYYDLEDIDDLNDCANELNELDSDDLYIINGLIQNYDSDLKEVLSIYRNGDYMIFENCYDMSDVACKIVEEGMFAYEIPEYLECYIDYKKLGRDLDFEGCFIQIDYSTIIRILR